MRVMFLPFLEHFRFSSSSGNALSFWFYAIPDAKPLRTFAGVALAVLALAGPAIAHDAASGWQYEQFCCNGNSHNGDCQMIPARSVRIIKGGFQVTLAPGDHRLATRSHIFHLSQDAARRSQDGEYHLCLYPTEDTPRCFYAPDMGY